MGYRVVNPPRPCYSDLKEALTAVAKQNQVRGTSCSLLFCFLSFLICCVPLSVQVMVTVMNDGYIRIVLNLIRSMEVLGVTNFLLIVTDVDAGKRLEELGLPCYLANNVQHMLDPGNQKFMSWVSSSYVKFVNARPTIIRNILEVTKCNAPQCHTNTKRKLPFVPTTSWGLM